MTKRPHRIPRAAVPALMVKIQRVFAANVHVYPLQYYEAPVACPN